MRFCRRQNQISRLPVNSYLSTGQRKEFLVKVPKKRCELMALILRQIEVEVKRFVHLLKVIDFKSINVIVSKLYLQEAHF